MNELEITKYITDTFANVETADTLGYTFYFYNSDHKLPFATLATQDNEGDRASNLDRLSIYRLNIGVSKDTFRALFGPTPPDPDGTVDTGYDFSALDRLMPHPVYAAQSWVCVLNPGAETFEAVKPLLAEAYEIAARRNAKREARG